jgi:signal transduction histidine kinase
MFLKNFIILFLFFWMAQSVFSQNHASEIKKAKELLKNAGKSFMNLDSKKSLEYAQSSLEFSLKNDDFILAAKAYNLIGLNFNEFSEYKKAIEYYKKGLDLANKTDNDTVKSWLHNNLGNMYCYRKIDFKKGIEHYKKGILFSEKLNDVYETTFSKLNIASAYIANEEYNLGIVYLNEIRDYIEKEGDIESKISLYSNYGSYYNVKNIDDKAEEFYLKSVKFCEMNDIELIKSNVMVVYYDISNFYFKIKNFEKAYFYLSKHSKLQDEIYNENIVKDVKIASVELDYDEISRKITQVEAEKKVQDEKLKNNKQLIIFSTILVLTLLLLLFSFIRNNTINKKINAELKTANSDLLIAKEKAEEASLLKTQFISTISHELRTPLYGVVGITDIIIDEHKELKTSPHLKSLKFSAKYLLALVNDILKVYKIEEKQVELQDDVFSVFDELATIKNALNFLALHNNNQILLEIDAKIPKKLIGDKIRLSQILINLISNSLKFTQNGNVTIKVELVHIENNNCQLKFKIIDTGIGIAKKDQEIVFDKFVQVYRKEDDYQGTGLGLTIVKKMVELFKGTIKLESEENKGTTFTLVINFDADVQKINQIIKRQEVDYSVKKEYKILVVEDNKINQLVTKKLLENNNFNCVIVSDGYEALDVLETIKFDAILMDINMPMINGFETSKRIRQKGITIPIIAVTAFDKQDIEDKIKDAFIDDVIVKPFDSQKLFQVIKQFVEK